MAMPPPPERQSTALRFTQHNDTRSRFHLTRALSAPSKSKASARGVRDGGRGVDQMQLVDIDSRWQSVARWVSARRRLDR